jgi:DHA1 family inner membrane transport protein
VNDVGNGVGNGVENGVERSKLAAITGAKAVANTALRWIPPFLPTLEVAFGATTTQLTTILGVGEFAGLSTLAIGTHLDRRKERLAMVVALGFVTSSSIIALQGSLTAFAIAFVVLILGVSNYTVAGHAWISHRVPFEGRARSIGLFEMSWALALLVGAPIVAVLIDVFGWRGPFVALAVASAVAALVVALMLTDDVGPSDVVQGEIGDGEPRQTEADRTAPAPGRRLTTTAWLVVSGSALLALAGLSVFVISGTWLTDAFGVSTSGIGALAIGFGAIELTASSAIAAFVDRVGKMRSTLTGLAVLGCGLVAIGTAGDSTAHGVIGLLMFLLGFEFAFVTSLSLTSEAMPNSRGVTLAIGNAVGTVARGVGVILSGILYGAFGISGTIGLSATAAIASVSCYLISRTTASGSLGT